MRASIFIPLALVVMVSACASAASSSGAPLRNVNHITTAELDETSASTAYEVIQYLRPSWLRTRGRMSLAGDPPLRVYLDGTYFGDVETLRQLSAQVVERMERLGASEATQRFGTDHTNGAILVYTR